MRSYTYAYVYMHTCLPPIAILQPNTVHLNFTWSQCVYGSGRSLNGVKEGFMHLFDLIRCEEKRTTKLAKYNNFSICCRYQSYGTHSLGIDWINLLAAMYNSSSYACRCCELLWATDLQKSKGFYSVPLFFDVYHYSSGWFLKIFYYVSLPQLCIRLQST